MSKSTKLVYLCASAFSQVIPVQIEALVFVAIGNEIDPVARPHRENVLGRIVGDVDRLLAVEIIDPDVVRLAAAIALPGAEFTEDAVVGELFDIRRIGTETAARQRQISRKGRRPPTPGADRP